MLGDWAKNVGEALREVPGDSLEDFVRNVCGFDPEGPRANGLGKLLDHAPQITAGFICGTWFNVEGPLTTPSKVGSKVMTKESV